MSHSATPIYTPLLTELADLLNQAKLPRQGLNALAPVHYSPAGLQALGEFLIRPDVWPCFILGVNVLEKQFVKRPRGRPKVEALVSQDARRAFRLWEHVRMFREFERTNDIEKMALSNRHLIETQMKVEPRIYADEPDEWLFPTSVAFETLEQSVSRGKKKLKIDADWQSKLCEELFSI